MPPNVRLQPGNETERQQGCYAGGIQTRANMSGRDLDNIIGENQVRVKVTETEIRI